MRVVKWTLLVVGAVVFALLMAMVAAYVATTRETAATQSGLDAFTPHLTPFQPSPAP